jgi:non-lysosomal glucosylceramidase
MIAFPLGGVAAGSIGLGGRGQLRDWEIYNRPDKGNAPGYAFPGIWVSTGKGRPVARVLEARYQPPYEGSSGLGARNAPGLQRLESAAFTGEYPFARIAFRDRRLPVRVALEAFTPIIPHVPDDSGLPIAVLRYRVTNPGATPVTASIAYALENPIFSADAARRNSLDKRVNERREDARLQGLLMSNPALDAADPMAGTLGLSVQHDRAGGGRVTVLRGWPRARWWTSVLKYWDDFAADGELGPEADDRGPVGAVCLQRVLAPGESADYTFVLSWSFPNRTPERCAWRASKGDEKVVIGNFYCTRFADAFAAAAYAVEHLPRLEARARQFATAVRESTIPAALRDAATANLSTLATQTCFRTSDGEFHGFEGCSDRVGCCPGSCTHVWNYEATTAHLFPTFSRSLRRAAFGHSLDDDGAMHFRETLPDGKERHGYAATDGQMGQIVKVYQDWRLSGDDGFLREYWPKAKKALAFAWREGSWDADRDGVLEGVQHNTYDVEFYGPNPQCGIYYLAALRAAEEMGRAVGDTTAADEARRLFDRGRAWTDAQLFNGEYYIQQVQGRPSASIHKSLRSEMGSENTEQPEYQLGNGCLVDQLIGQYLADVAGLGPIVDPAHCRTTLASIYRDNYKRELVDHACLQRTYVLNDEAALVVCDYGRGERPAVPFPYYAEAWTGLEYATGAQMIFAGLTREGVECFTNVRVRYDGERRNPWNEPECGHHYARAMSAWSGLLAMSGFRYHAVTREVSIDPRARLGGFRCFWSSGTGWGSFAYDAAGRSARVRVLHGRLPLAALDVRLARGAAPTGVALGDNRVPATIEPRGTLTRITLAKPVTLDEGSELRLV